LVDSFDTDGAGYATPRYYRFAGVVFDKLVFTQDIAPPALLDRLYAVDQLQVRAIPLPAAWISVRGRMLAPYAQRKKGVAGERGSAESRGERRAMSAERRSARTPSCCARWRRSTPR